MKCSMSINVTFVICFHKTIIYYNVTIPSYK